MMEGKRKALHLFDWRTCDQKCPPPFLSVHFLLPTSVTFQHVYSLWTVSPTRRASWGALALKRKEVLLMPSWLHTTLIMKHLVHTSLFKYQAKIGQWLISFSIDLGINCSHRADDQNMAEPQLPSLNFLMSDRRFCENLHMCNVTNIQVVFSYLHILKTFLYKVPC